MIGITSHPTKKGIAQIDTTIKRLLLTINRFEKENKHSFFNTDTVFMVHFQGAEHASLSEIIWNRNASCYYDYDFDMERGKVFNQKFSIKTDASDLIKSFNPEFRVFVESGDTAGYRKYAYEHRVYDGAWVSSIIAIKKGQKWKFITFKGAGWAMDCFYSPPKKDAPSNLRAVINSLSKERLGFDIDSASTAYIKDSSKYKKQPSYPVILLDDKVINYQKLESIEVYRIKAISVWTKNSHNPAIPNGINSEFGIIAISTDRKSN